MTRHPGEPLNKIPAKAAALLVAAGILALGIGTAAAMGKPDNPGSGGGGGGSGTTEFTKAAASLEAFSLVVKFTEVGLKGVDKVDYLLSATVEATYGCFAKGVGIPSSPGGDTYDVGPELVIIDWTIWNVRNRVSDATYMSPPELPSGSLTCDEGDIILVRAVTYANIDLRDVSTDEMDDIVAQVIPNYLLAGF